MQCVCVLDTHCAEYGDGDGKGLKPPTCDEHWELPGGHDGINPAEQSIRAMDKDIGQEVIQDMVLS